MIVFCACVGIGFVCFVQLAAITNDKIKISVFMAIKIKVYY